MNIKFHTLLLSTILFLLGCSNKSLPLTTTKAVEKVDVQIVLLAGQSNMAGAGNYDELDDGTKARIKAVANRVTVDRGVKKSAPYALSYYPNKRSEKYDFDKRFGPELLIGITLVEKNLTQEYLLIKKSQGGTALYGAWNPDWTAEKAKAVEKVKKQNMQLYNDHLTSIRQHLNRLKKEGKTFKIIGLAWMQGENDAGKEISATTYEVNLKRLIEKYRTDLNVPNLPVVIGQINSHYGKFKKYGPTMVRKAIAAVANADEKVIMIPTTADAPYDDFPKHPDNVHYNTEGQRRLGIAFGEALLFLN